jgi:hypothetical protein
MTTSQSMNQLRDQFAAAVAAAISPSQISGQGSNMQVADPLKIADIAYTIADALLWERSQGNNLTLPVRLAARIKGTMPRKPPIIS